LTGRQTAVLYVMKAVNKLLNINRASTCWACRTYHEQMITPMTETQRSNRRLLILFLIAILIAIIPWIVLAQEPPIKKDKYFLHKESEEEIGYTQAIKVGNTIYISGVAGKGPMDQALSKVYGRLETILKNNNTTFQNVVKETLYTTQIDEVIKNREVRKKFYNGDFPAASWVEVKRLYMPDAVLEVELVVVVKD
jgi:2-iminobutanoate/2-iminopropanoate deaminase